MAATASQLRWRARIAKEAVLNDDSTVDERSAWFSPRSRRKKPTSSQELRSLVVRITVGTATVLSILSLKTTHFWWATLTSTMIIAISSLVVYQDFCLREWGSLRKNQNELRTQAQQLHARNERLYRTLASMDQSVEKVSSVTQSLNELSKDTDSLTSLVLEHKQLTHKLQEATQTKGQMMIIKTFLDNDTDRNFQLSAQEVERLIVQLHSVPGMTLDEAKLRNIFQQTTSLDTLFTLLRDESIFKNKHVRTGNLLD